MVNSIVEIKWPLRLMAPKLVEFWSVPEYGLWTIELEVLTQINL